MRIQDLRPGDRLATSPSFAGSGVDGATLISWSVPHPIHQGLALVVWRLSTGELSFDALDPEQYDVTGSRLVEQSEDQRLESLRRAIEGPAAAEDRDPGEPLNAIFDNQPTVVDPPEVQHFIALIDGMHAHTTLTATAADGRIHRNDTRNPWAPMELDRTPLWFRVDAATAEEWVRDEDES